MKLSPETILLSLIALDYLTGVLVAISERQLNSTIGRKGIFSKVGIIICVVVCKLIDLLQISEFTPLLPLVSVFFILNECLSILENLNKLNVPIPKPLLSTLKNFKEKCDT